MTNPISYGLVLPSGKQPQFANWKMAIEIVNLPIKTGGSFHSYVNVCQRVTQWIGLKEQ